VDIGQLVADHHAAVYRYAHRLTGSAVDAEDLTQQVFLLVQRKVGQIRDMHCVRSWLFTALRNSYLETRRRRIPIPAASLEIDVESIPDEIPAEPIDSERLQNAIDGLTDEFKLVVLMFYFEKCSYREMAERLNVPLGTVMSRLSRAKGHLRRQLIPLGVRATNRCSHEGFDPRSVMP
jgi:RNA polymerase sigma-70 factor (ECF subfamily)